MAQPPVVVAFARALTELVTVEKKNIVALTEIARDVLRTEPAAAPSLAALITTRILQAPPPQKLPSLYLLDSISKLIGEPYKTLFAASLPEAYMSAWLVGRSLHRPLDKLLGTWVGVYPQPLLADIQQRVAAAHAAAQPAHMQQPQNGYGAGGMLPQAGHVAQQQPFFAQQPQPYGMQQQQPYGMPPAAGGYGAPQYGAPVQQQPYYQQQQSQQFQQPYAATVPVQQQQQPPIPAQQPQQANVPDLLSSLMAAGLLSAPGTQPAAGAAPAVALPAPTSSGIAAHSTPPYTSAATATPEREQPATTSFTPDRIKERNPSAVARLLRQTEATKSRFLDRKFLRRQQKAAGAAARASRFWYLDLDTWQASTVGAAPGGGSTAGAGTTDGAGGRGGQQAAAAAAAAAVPKKYSVPVDDSQTHCALSGEQFEQFWDEGHQEWRYRDAKALDAEEAASYGLEEGAIVLVSALGKPAASVLQHPADLGGAAAGGGGVLAELQARHEIAADLAAATAAVDETRAAGDAKDAKAGVVQQPDEEQPAAAAETIAAVAVESEAAEEPQEKRQRVA